MAIKSPFSFSTEPRFAVVENKTAKISHESIFYLRVRVYFLIIHFFRLLFADIGDNELYFREKIVNFLIKSI